MAGGLTGFVLLPAGLWWAVMAGGMWIAARRSRRGVWLISALGFAVLGALSLDLRARSGGEPLDIYWNIATGVVLPITAIGQGLLTWWMLGRARS